MANFNFNKVTLGGRIVNDLELKKTQQGISVLSFSIAINRRGSSTESDYINVVAWRQTAEFISSYFRRGSSICVNGSIQTRSWTDTKSGTKKYATEVIADEAFFVDSKAETEKSSPTSVEPHYEEIGEDDDLPF